MLTRLSSSLYFVFILPSMCFCVITKMWPIFSVIELKSGAWLVDNAPVSLYRMFQHFFVKSGHTTFDVYMPREHTIKYKVRMKVTSYQHFCLFILEKFTADLCI